MHPSSPEILRPVFFFPDQLDLSMPVDLYQPGLLARSATSAVPSGSGWANFETCSLSIDRWNRDFCGPVFAGMDTGERLMKQLTLSVTLNDGVGYRVQTSAYAFDRQFQLLGLLDLRYFGKGMPRELHFDMSGHSLALSTHLQIAFQVSGGGGPHVPRPPLVTSVAIAVTG